MFYIVIILLALVRMYFSLFYFYERTHAAYFGDLMKPILNLNLGVIQCWILLELALRINESIKFTASISVLEINQVQKDVE